MDNHNVVDSKKNSKLVEFATRLLKIRRISTVVILCTGLLAIIIIFVTIYATQVGNFVIRTSRGEYKLMIGETIDTINKDLLMAKGVDGITNTTFSRIDSNTIRKTDGSSNSVTHLGYTFYVQNQSQTTINYNINLSIRAVYKNVDTATWIRVYETREYGTPNERETVVYTYAKANAETGGPESCLNLPEGTGHTEQQKGILPTNFISDITIFDYNINTMRGDRDGNGEIIKYTFIIWLEGWDPDCTNDLFAGSLRMDLQFNAFGG